MNLSFENKVALVTGAVHPQLYAVVDLDWRRTFETGLPITALAFLAGALLIWLHARGTLQYYPAFVLPARLTPFPVKCRIAQRMI